MNTLGYIKYVILDEMKSIKEEVMESKILTTTFILIIIGLVIYLRPFPERQVYFLSGYPGSDWAAIANNTKEILAKNDIEMSVINTEGAIENVMELNDPKNKANAGFTYGLALHDSELNDIYSLGSVQYEPVWILYNSKKVRQIESLQDLAKYKIGIGPSKSGSHRIAKKIFELAQVHVSGNPHFVSDTVYNIQSKLKNGEIDAIVLVSTNVDAVTQDLLRHPNIEIFNFKNAAAFSRQNNSFVTLSLPADSVSIANHIPPKDVTLLATTTSLVVKKDMHPDLQLALLMAAKEVNRNSHNLFFAKRNEFPAYRDPLITISPVAQRFYDYGPPHAMRHLPYWLAGLIDRAWILLLTIFAVFYPISKLNIHLRKFRFRLKEIPHYKKLLEIERKLLQSPVSVNEKYEMLRELDRINAHAISSDVPITEEAAYFNFLNAIFLLKVKIRDSLNEVDGSKETPSN